MAGPIAEAFVQITPDFRNFGRELDAGIRQGTSGAEHSADAASAHITESFTAGALDVEAVFQAMSVAVSEAIAEVAVTAPVTAARVGASFDAAAANIAEAFNVAQVSADAQLAEIGGPGIFARVIEQARLAGAKIVSTFDETQKEADHQLRQIGGADAAGGGLFAGLIGRAALLGGGALAVGGAALTAFGVKGAADLEQVTIAFTGLLGGAQQANDFLVKLKDFAATTPFEFKDVTKASQQLIALGKTGDQALDILRTIGNAAAAVGASGDSISHVTLAIAQIQAKGKLSAQELNQIAEALPNLDRGAILQNLADKLGITTAAAQALADQGGITANDGINAILLAMQNVPGAAADATTGLDAMGRQSQTLLGLLSTFKDTAKFQLNDAFSPLADVVKQMLPAATESFKGFLGSVAPALSGVAGGLLGVLNPLVASLGPVLGEILTPLGDAIKAITPALSAFFGSVADAFRENRTEIAALFSALATVIIAILPALDPLIRAFSTFVGILADIFVPVMNALAPVIGPLVPLLLAFINPWLLLLPLLDVLGPVLRDIATTLGGVLAVALPPLVAGLGAAAEVIGGALLQVFQALQPFIPELAKAFTDLLLAFVPLLPLFAELAVAILIPLIPLMPGLVQEFVLFVETLTQLVGIVALVLDAFRPLFPILGPILLAIGAIALAIAVFSPPVAVVALGVAIATLFTKVIPLVDILKEVGSIIAGPFQTAFDKAKGVFAAFQNGLALLATGLDRIISFFTGLPDRITSAVETGFSSVIDFFVSIPGRLVDALVALPDVLGNLFQMAIQAVLDILGIELQLLVDLFINLPLQLIGALIGLDLLIYETIIGAVLNVVTAMPGVLLSIVDFFVGLPGQILGALATFAGVLGGAFTDAFEAVKTTVQDGIKAVVGFVEEIPGKLGGFVTTIADKAKEIGSAIFDGISGVLTGLPAALKSGVHAAAQGIVGVINSILGWLKDHLQFDLPSIDIFGQSIGGQHIGFPDLKIGDIPEFGNGGIFDRRTLGFLGEAGSEVLLPLTRPARAQELADRSGLTSQLAPSLGNVSMTVVGPDPVETSREVMRRLRSVGTRPLR